MKLIQYDGFELDHFDSAYNFRKYQISLIKNYLSGKLLEVGPGKGGLTFFYSQFVKKPTLIEPEKKLYKLLKKKFNKKDFVIRNCTINKIQKKFDTIMYFDVLEHIKNDLGEIKTASKKLKKNRYLIFSVPAYQSFYSSFDKSVGHYKRYNKKDFIKISKKTGLKIDKLIYYDSIGFFLLVLNRIFLLKQTNLKNKLFFWNLLIPLSKIIDFFTFNKFGKSLLCVFKK
jgi:phospholipid N-methyltransferase|tara:strand:- start:58 stop:741 length:684 start_codon:yes stop_codon:yes gene_type:complete